MRRHPPRCLAGFPWNHWPGSNGITGRDRLEFAGKGTDIALGIAVDSSDSAYITGYTVSTETTTFPVTVGPGQFANGDVDAFIAKIREDDFPWPAFLPAIMEGAKKK